MNEGKNRWTVAYLQDEIWKVRIDVNHEKRISTASEFIQYKTTFLEYWHVMFIFGIYRHKGECISGDLTYAHGRTESNRHVLDLVKNFKDSDTPYLSDEDTLTFIYLGKLYDLTHNRMLTSEEYKQFKSMYHALQRGDIDTLTINLKGRKAMNGEPEIKPYKPQRILNFNKEFR